MGGSGKRLLASILGVAGAAGLAAGIVMFTDARLGSVQADLTQEKIYTLSPGTRAVLAGLKEPVTLRLFYSPRLGTEVPSFGSYADQVREMLHRYAALSHGMVRVETLDPEPFSAAEDRALAYGLQGVPLNQSGEQVYFGLAGTNMLDDERSIAFLNPDRERFLEYDLTKLVWSLSNPKKPVVGIMTPLPVDGDARMMMMTRGQAGRPWLSLMLLRESDVVKTVATDATAIDPDIQVLLLAHPQHLSEATLYAIDQFVMRGGRLMVLVDPRSEAQAGMPGPGGQPPADTSSDLKKLFDAWGIVYTPDKVVGDLTGAWQVRAKPGDRVEAVQYLPWFNIRAGISPTDPATADLHQISVASAGYLEKKPGAGIDFTPILETDRKSGLIPLAQVGNDADPAQILAGFRPDGVRRVIAARVHGVLHSAFSGPPAEPAAAPGAPKPAVPGPYKAETDGAANLVVIADTDLLSDRFWVREQDFFGQQNPQPFSDNGPFIANLVGSLAGGDALIGLRGRGPSIRPFTVVENMQREAEAHFRQTEQALQQHLNATEAKLQMLRRGSASGEGRTTLTPEQEQAIAEARREIVDTQAKLRTVQHDLRRDIDALETRTRLYDIIAVPAVLTLLAIFIGLVRSRRRARARG